MSARKHSHGSLSFQIEQSDNGSLIATVLQETNRQPKDDVGALYYVVVVIFIYGCSILMMIASYIRKNKIDQKLNRYLKEMANVRKREQQMKLFQAAQKAAEVTRNSENNIRRGLDRRGEFAANAPDCCGIDEVVVESEEEGANRRRRSRASDDDVIAASSAVATVYVTTPLIHVDGDGEYRKTPCGDDGGGDSGSARDPRRGGLNNVRILCNEGDDRADGVHIKSVTVYEPRTGKSVQLWMRAGTVPGSACLDTRREGEDGSTGPNMYDSEEAANPTGDEESADPGDDSSSSSPSPSDSFTSDCQIVTSV